MSVQTIPYLTKYIIGPAVAVATTGLVAVETAQPFKPTLDETKIVSIAGKKMTVFDAMGFRVTERGTGEFDEPPERLAVQLKDVNSSEVIGERSIRIYKETPRCPGIPLTASQRKLKSDMGIRACDAKALDENSQDIGF